MQNVSPPVLSTVRRNVIGPEQLPGPPSVMKPLLLPPLLDDDDELLLLLVEPPSESPTRSPPPPLQATTIAATSPSANTIETSRLNEERIPSSYRVVNRRPMIAFFGTGLLGSGFVQALRRRGEDVHVWNRTRSKATLLEAYGAKSEDDPAVAAKGAERIHLSLSDDAAVDEVLERARPSITASTLIVDHTTTTASGTVARFERWKARGVGFVHAPVFMGPQNALESTGLMLVSGDRVLVDKARPHIEKMTGKVLDLGDRVDAAAAFKLMGNMFLMFLTSGLAEVFTLARALDVDPKVAATLFEHFNPGLTLKARIDRMLSGDLGKASWELGMARKDARLMLEEAAHGHETMHVLPAIAARMDELIAQGHGKDDWTILVKDALKDG